VLEQQFPEPEQHFEGPGQHGVWLLQELSEWPTTATGSGNEADGVIASTATSSNPASAEGASYGTSAVTARQDASAVTSASEVSQYWRHVRACMAV